MSKSVKKLVTADFNKVIADIIDYRQLYYFGLPLAFIFSIIYACSFPSYYTCSIKLAPEISTQGRMLSAYDMSILGFQMELDDRKEAVYPKVYPILMNNVDFKTSLFPIIVKRSTDGKMFSYYEYLLKEQKMPWWTSLYKRLIKLTFHRKDPNPNATVNPFRLNVAQTNIMDVLSNRIKCEVNNRNWVITIKVKDQDPLIAATMADSVALKLQQFIYDYRTAKAQNDLDYCKLKYNKAKAQYEESERQYVLYADANREMTLEKGLQQLRSLEEEMNIRYNLLEQYSKDVINAEMKVQEEVPVFVPLQSATVPVEKSSPIRTRYFFSAFSLFFYAITLWILYKEDDLRMFVTVR